MKNNFEDSFEYKVIYIFTINDDNHKGLLKIGDTKLHTEISIDKLVPNSRELNQAALKRIKSYTNTAGVSPNLLHTEIAVKYIKDKDGSIKLEGFRDYDVHQVLKNSNIDNVILGNTTGREWFRIDLETAKEAINAVKQNLENLSNSKVKKFSPIKFRPEQEEAIKKTVKQFKKSDRMLWNAKMRFGKTISALEVIKQMKFKKSIIITHRPVVNDGWYEDFGKIFDSKSNYIYGSKTNGNSVEELLKSNSNFVYFASIQDLRGSSSVGGKFNKNNIIFNTIWDCVIVDEAHEGTTTALGDETIKAIFKEGAGTKFLALSGTPFNILTDFDENSIYTWDYIMEQECKNKWDKLHFGDSNPYEELPQLKIYTYNLGDIIANKDFIAFEDKAFNFHEFFRTWTGDFNIDCAHIPPSANKGDFIHEADVWSLLNLITKDDDKSCYPFANEKYRNLFKHSLWMVPGVKEARALKKLMLKHPVFGSGAFNIVNVAGDGDEEEKSIEALSKVRKAIKEAGEYNYTITLSCGKLTTGVTVKEWTAVFMLSGSYSTSAANYLQTIFRVQSPCNKNGKFKEIGYVFDFAPDRALKMIASAVSVSGKAGKTNDKDKRILGQFLNFCPVISISGSQMKEYNTNILLQQLKRAYADKVVRNGFDDVNLYNDELYKLQDIDIEKFNDLKGIIGTSKAASKTKDIPINKQGFTDEEYEVFKKLNKKKKKELTEEEKRRLEELNKTKKLRSNAISILRGISIRMPLLIYGADIPYDEEITLDHFIDIVDDSSWEEFMPNGVTKDIFKEFKKYYDEEVFIAAGRKIRNIAKKADALEPTERVKKIASLFSYFKNPDKETVLTPWRVVNMHMSDCVGGYDFWDINHEETINEPRFVDKGKVTNNIFGNLDCNILEINSKTGLYPLYMTYSAYRAKCDKYTINELTTQKKKELWIQTIKKNIFVICKTPMAKAITKRTLVGYNDYRINAHYFSDLVNVMKNKPQHFINKILRGSYWKRKESIMKFDAIVGNPPYQQMDGGNGASASPIYNYFIEQSKRLEPKYLSLIVPARWYAGGKGLDDFRYNMLTDNRLSVIHDFPETSECFTNINIRGGICYFLWDKNHKGECCIVNHKDGKILDETTRPLLESKLLEKGNIAFIRYNKAIDILRKVQAFNENTMEELVSARKPFGLATNFKDFELQMTKEKDIYLYRFGDNGYISINDIEKNRDWVYKYKIFEPYASPGSDDYPHLVLSKPIVAPPNTACTETYLVIAPSDDEIRTRNIAKYMETQFFRFMLILLKNTQHITQKVYSFVPQQDFTKEWTDEKLYEKYGISEEEIAFINTMVKPLKK